MDFWGPLETLRKQIKGHSSPADRIVESNRETRSIKENFGSSSTNHPHPRLSFSRSSSRHLLLSFKWFFLVWCGGGGSLCSVLLCVFFFYSKKKKKKKKKKKNERVGKRGRVCFVSADGGNRRRHRLRPDVPKKRVGEKDNEEEKELKRRR